MNPAPYSFGCDGQLAVLAPPSFYRSLLNARDWMTAGAFLLLSNKNRPEDSIAHATLLAGTEVEGDSDGEALLLAALGVKGLNLDFNDDGEVVLSDANFDRCMFHLYNNGSATPGVAAILSGVNAGNRLLPLLRKK